MLVVQGNGIVAEAGAEEPVFLEYFPELVVLDVAGLGGDLFDAVGRGESGEEKAGIG